MPWKPRHSSALEKETHALQMALLKLRRELSNKEEHVGRLEILLRERLAKVDELNGKTDQLREQNRRPAYFDVRDHWRAGIH